MYNPLKPGSAVPDDDTDEDDGSGGADFSDPLQRRFVYLVVVFNVALLVAAIGLLLVAFDGDVTLGGPLAVLGLAGLAYGLYDYRRTRRRIDAGELGNADDDADTE